ncbi:MAG: methylaspartate mutase subunit S [Salinirussus sp.]
MSDAQPGHTVVTGVIGDDIHVVGLRVIEHALEDAGYEVVSLGVQTPADEFLEAAVETAADAIVVSSMSGHAREVCQGFGGRAAEYGLEDVPLYLGGNLAVGERDDEELRALFTGPDYGFDRVFTADASPDRLLDALAADLGPPDRG